jgi:N-acylneuraminate cytidylyltransferase/CMP-N,N'-diacetyllegionaminic acid synthase|tara:strand:- start:389 stop:1102 length:714 start_codon:yes stop_codon:yes gene_type:complete
LGKIESENEVLAVIPARGGSRGVPKKNIRPVKGKPLIIYTIEVAKRCEVITDLVVSTDDPEISKVSVENGVEVPFFRPAELATDTALAIPTIQHSVKMMEKEKETIYDIVVMLQPTTPLRSVSDISECLQLLINSDADGIISVVQVNNSHPMKMKKIVDGLLVDYEEPLVENPPRQLLPPVYIVNGAIYATRRDTLMHEDSFMGNKCLPYTMPEERSVNIDSKLDFKLVEAIIANDG